MTTQQHTHTLNGEIKQWLLSGWMIRPQNNQLPLKMLVRKSSIIHCTLKLFENNKVLSTTVPSSVQWPNNFIDNSTTEYEWEVHVSALQ